MEINGIPIVDAPIGDAASTASLTQNFDQFLTLLTTQLQNQDPLSPMDTTEFTNQLTQFAQVEQGINSNKKLEQLINLQSTSQLSTGVFYIGKIAEIPGNKIQLEDGAGKLGYILDDTAAATTIQILDLNGSVVRTVQGATSAGAHQFTWDGKDDNGQQLADGTYGAVTTAIDGEGSAIGVSTTAFLRVTGVSRDGDGAVLNLGNETAGLDEILAILDNI